MGKFFSIPLRESQINSRGKIGKVEGAVAGNFASFNSEGSIVDSGYKVATDSIVFAVLDEVINKAKADIGVIAEAFPTIEEHDIAGDDQVFAMIDEIFDKLHSDVRLIEADLPEIEENEVATDDFVEYETDKIFDSAFSEVAVIKSNLDNL